MSDMNPFDVTSVDATTPIDTFAVLASKLLIRLRNEMDAIYKCFLWLLQTGCVITFTNQWVSHSNSS